MSITVSVVMQKVVDLELPYQPTKNHLLVGSFFSCRPLLASLLLLFVLNESYPRTLGPLERFKFICVFKKC